MGQMGFRQPATRQTWCQWRTKSTPSDALLPSVSKGLAYTDAPLRVFQSPTNLRSVASALRSGPVAPQSTHIAKYRSPLTIRVEPQNGHGFAPNNRVELTGGSLGC